ncbi:MAG: ATP-binding protein [Pontiella sp.]
MLIEFKVKNFRSIRDEQTFSLVAGKADKNLPECLIDKNLKGLSGIQYLKGAAIYGANASGKTNVMQALRFLADFVRRSATKVQPGDQTGVQPYKLDQSSITQASEFEVTFETQGTRYLYGIALTTERVIEEYLYAYPKGLPQSWCHRTYNDSTKNFEWEKPSTAFKTDKKLQDYTKENTLFLSVGAQWNHEQLTNVFNWFKNDLRFVHLSANDFGLSPSFTAKQLADPEIHHRIVSLLQNADFGISEANTKEQEVEYRKGLDIGLGALDVEQNKESKKRTKLVINLVHQSAAGEPIFMDFDSEESAGTRRFFSLIGPWLDILDNGYTVFIDEIDTSLHPLLVRELLKLLFCKKNNPLGAQVIFTTHNPVFLDQTLIRRDQVWFTEKNEQGATLLYPLTDYKPRDKEALSKRYLAGVYGAIPDLAEGLKL